MGAPGLGTSSKILEPVRKGRREEGWRRPSLLPCCYGVLGEGRGGGGLAEAKKP
jgi:hypothetical protein